MQDLQKKLAELFELQLIDSEIIENMREIRRLDKSQDPVQRKYNDLMAKKDEIGKSQEPIKRDIQEMKDKNAAHLEKKKEVEDKLFSAASDPKELQFLQKEREQLIRLMKANDDEVIKKMIEVDSVEIRKNEILDKVKEIEGEYKKVCEERDKRKEELKGRIESLKKERMKFKSFEDKALLGIYQQLQKENNGLAIATVDDNVCEGCFVEVSSATQQRLQYYDEIVYCQQCGRILYVPVGK